MTIFFRYTQLLLTSAVLWLGVGLSTVRAQGRFWGMTAGGGANGLGAIFYIGADGTGPGVAYSFSSGTTSGNTPQGSLVQAGGKLWGTTQYGGQQNRGTVFSYDTTTGVYTNIHSFTVSTGYYPYGGLCAGPDGNLYLTLYVSGNAGALTEARPGDEVRIRAT